MNDLPGQKYNVSCTSAISYSSGSGSVFEILKKGDTVAVANVFTLEKLKVMENQMAATTAVPPSPFGDSELVIDDLKVADLTKCMLDFKGMVKPMRFSGSSDDWKIAR